MRRPSASANTTGSPSRTAATQEFDWRVVVLAIISGVLLLRLHWGIPAVLGVASGLALAIRYAGI